MTPSQRYYTEPPRDAEQEASQEWHRELCDLLYLAACRDTPPLTAAQRQRKQELMILLSPSVTIPPT